MDLPHPLASHLRDLVESIGTGGDDTLTGALEALTSHLRAAVSSYLGFRLTLVVDGWPITLTAFPVLDGERPATSLRLNLSNQGPDFDSDSQIVLYAGRPGAFVDLAADIDYVHRRGRTTGTDGNSGGSVVDGLSAVHDGGQRPVVALDIDLPPVTLVSGFIGLTEYANINRAIGMLIQRGHDPAEAHATLHRDAWSSGLAVHQYADRLLER